MPPASHKALFYGDYFARPSKRSGAWMTSLRDQQKLDGEVAPLILNVCNFSKGADGEPSLLSPDDARTLFHEFGHALHGMLSDVTYPSLSGTSRVHRFRRAALAALRALAGAAAGAAAVRAALPDRRAAAGRPAEALHRRAQIQPGLCHRGIRLLGADRSRIPHPAGVRQSRTCGRSNARNWKRSACPRKSRCGTGRQQFGHIFSGDHYASGYYSYMWSEVMDADAFGAFEEAGDIFDPGGRQTAA